MLRLLIILLFGLACESTGVILLKKGMTQIVVTHEMRFAREASDYIMFIDKGEIVEMSGKDEIFEHPKDARTRDFLKNFA